MSTYSWPTSCTVTFTAPTLPTDLSREALTAREALIGRFDAAL